MRQTARLLSTYLEPGAPTGLAGLLTHPNPRSALLYLYNQTLTRLEPIPKTSLYRRSVEALTQHRKSLVEVVRPSGHDEWLQKTKGTLSAATRQQRCTFIKLAGHTMLAPPIRPEDSPNEVLNSELLADFSTSQVLVATYREPQGSGQGRWSIVTYGVDERESLLDKPHIIPVARTRRSTSMTSTPVAWEWEQLPEISGEPLELLKKAVETEWSARSKRKADQRIVFAITDKPHTETERNFVEIEAEPRLTEEQVAELEANLRAGLIEEVIEVGQGELKLVDVMATAKSWEPLEEKPTDGQWTYFGRDST